MKAKLILGVLSILIFVALLISGCGGGSSSSSSSGTGTLKLSLTDAPAADNFTAVNLTISQIKISQSSDTNTDSWITLSNTPTTINLLTLNNAVLQELGIRSLPAGQYNQIRFYVTSAQVVVGGQTFGINVPSGMFRTAGSFTIQNGITTELVVDFNVAKSVVKEGNGSYQLQPTTRLTSLVTTGAISGTVTLSPVSAGTLITVSTTDSSGNTISTICRSDGTFTLGYLPVGSYNLTIEALGYNNDTTLSNITVSAGNTTQLNPVTLSQSSQ